MKALVLETYNRLVYKDVPDPVLQPDDVMVQVMACGICGSDVHGMDGSTGRRIPPLIMGHEASGVIVETGARVEHWQAGERVTFDSTIYRLDDWYSRKGLYNLSDKRMVLGVSPGEYKREGAFADYVTVPAHILYRIPEGVSFYQAAMVEPAAVAAHAVSLTPIELNDTAVVVGAGMIGLFIIRLLRLAGCGKIIAIDLLEDKLAMAKKFGADICLSSADANLHDIILKNSEQRGADIAFDAVGIQETIITAINVLRKGGVLTLVGNLTPKVDLPLQTVVTRQLHLQGSCAIAGEYPVILQLISTGKIRIDDILTTAVPLSQGAVWFNKLYKKEPGLLKILLVPDSVYKENNG
jgi:threonine dehydrogenase-like Zn-dependent dehydrogenase